MIVHENLGCTNAEKSKTVFTLEKFTLGCPNFADLKLGCTSKSTIIMFISGRTPFGYTVSKKKNPRYRVTFL